VESECGKMLEEGFQKRGEYFAYVENDDDGSIDVHK
jgi:hypothetical protein